MARYISIGRYQRQEQKIKEITEEVGLIKKTMTEVLKNVEKGLPKKKTTKKSKKKE